MFSRHELRESAAMGRSMHLWRFGHYGVPLLVLPSASGVAHEWEYNGLIEALRELMVLCQRLEAPIPPVFSSVHRVESCIEA